MDTVREVEIETAAFKGRPVVGTGSLTLLTVGLGLGGHVIKAQRYSFASV
jgi:hypothetical protein